MIPKINNGALICICLSALLYHSAAFARTTLARNDVLPPFTADPQLFLTDKERLFLKDPEFAEEKRTFVFFTAAPFGQAADRGRDQKGEKEIAGIPVELSDLNGHISMIPLLFGAVPAGQTLPPLLQTARANLFPGVPANQAIENGRFIDPEQRFGFLSCPLKYRKKGVRFDFVANFFAGIGLHVQTGLVSICQGPDQRQEISADVTPSMVDSIMEDFGDSASTVTEIPGKDLTCLTNFNDCFNPAPLTIPEVVRYLTSQFTCIAQEMGYNLCPFDKTSVEEIRFSLFWRTPYELNREKPQWPHVFILPWLEFGGSVSPGKLIDPLQLYAVPFGNNGHNAVFLRTGLNFDFIETVEVGAEVGIKHFFARDFNNLPVPTSKFQQEIFPFSTCAHVSPGHSWYFSLHMSAYHFLHQLSGYVYFYIMNHEKDSVKLLDPDPAFLPYVLENVSLYKAKLLHLALTYDISPNTQLGFVWQAPIDQNATYRSSTVMFTFTASF